MKELLKKLCEEFEIDPEKEIQFQINGEYFDLVKNNKDEWILYTVFGKDLDLDTKPLRRMTRKEVEQVLKSKYNKIKVY